MGELTVYNYFIDASCKIRMSLGAGGGANTHLRPVNRHGACHPSRETGTLLLFVISLEPRVG